MGTFKFKLMENCVICSCLTATILKADTRVSNLTLWTEDRQIKRDENPVWDGRPAGATVSKFQPLHGMDRQAHKLQKYLLSDLNCPSSRCPNVGISTDTHDWQPYMYKQLHRQAHVLHQSRQVHCVDCHVVQRESQREPIFDDLCTTQMAYAHDKLQNKNCMCNLKFRANKSNEHPSNDSNEKVVLSRFCKWMQKCPNICEWRIVTVHSACTIQSLTHECFSFSTPDSMFPRSRSQRSWPHAAKRHETADIHSGFDPMRDTRHEIAHRRPWRQVHFAVERCRDIFYNHSSNTSSPAVRHAHLDMTLQKLSSPAVRHAHFFISLQTHSSPAIRPSVKIMVHHMPRPFEIPKSMRTLVQKVRRGPLLRGILDLYLVFGLCARFMSMIDILLCSSGSAVFRPKRF